jgi:hypothetical protein
MRWLRSLKYRYQRQLPWDRYCQMAVCAWLRCRPQWT